MIAKAVAGRITFNSMHPAPASLREPPPPRSDTNAPFATADQSANDSRENPLSTDDSAQRDNAESSTHDEPELREHFQRGLGAYPLRNRHPAALLSVRDASQPIGSTCNTGCVLLASTSQADPKTRKQALRDDRAGWTAAKRAEIANHTDNGSWELIDRATVPHGRTL
eukprot:6200005-Pleurochrysis_carterae.AAC.1